MHGEGEHAELSLRIARDEPALFIHPRLEEIGQRHDLVGLALHEQSGDRERIHADIQHRTSGKRTVPEAVLHILIVVKTTEVDLRKTKSAKLSGARTTHKLDIEGHVQDRLCRAYASVSYTHLMCRTAGCLERLVSEVIGLASGVERPHTAVDGVRAGRERRVKWLRSAGRCEQFWFGKTC